MVSFVEHERCSALWVAGAGGQEGMARLEYGTDCCIAVELLGLAFTALYPRALRVFVCVLAGAQGV